MGRIGQSYIKTIAKCLSKDAFMRVMERMVELKLLEAASSEGIALGCGCANTISWLMRVVPLTNSPAERIIKAANQGGMVLMKHVCPTPLPADRRLCGSPQENRRTQR